MNKDNEYNTSKVNLTGRPQGWLALECLMNSNVIGRAMETPWSVFKQKKEPF